MRGNRRQDTRPELALRKAVHSLGLRYRVGARPLPDKRWTADLVFTRARVAVFVDGCFWHGCAQHFAAPRTNGTYWGRKIARNRERDMITERDLVDARWAVVRIWEHEDIGAAVCRVVEAVRGAEGG